MHMNASELVAEFVRRIDAVLSGGMADPYSLLNDNIIVTIIGTTPLSGSYFGVEELRQILVATAALRIRSGRVRLLDSLGEGDKLGAFLEVKAETRDGKIYNAAGDPSGCFFRICDGRIAEIRFYPDTTQVETQLYGRAFVPSAAPHGEIGHS